MNETNKPENEDALDPRLALNQISDFVSTTTLEALPESARKMVHAAFAVIWNWGAREGQAHRGEGHPENPFKTGVVDV